jgi:hypothetical protein
MTSDTRNKHCEMKHVLAEDHKNLKRYSIVYIPVSGATHILTNCIIHLYK